MKRLTLTNHLRFLLVSLTFVLSGCVTQLAPRYDTVVVDGLATASTDAMTLLATATHGTTRATFPQREEKYNSVIGKFEALAVQAAARPMPKNKASDLVNKVLQNHGTAALKDDEFVPPSVHAIKEVAETITKMRDTDKKQGITEAEALLFKRQVSIYLDQAMTYENFLQR
jgi:hypothetical protein